MISKETLKWSKKANQTMTARAVKRGRSTMEGPLDPLGKTGKARMGPSGPSGGKGGTKYRVYGDDEAATTAILTASIMPFITDMLPAYFNTAGVNKFITAADGGIVGVVPPQSRNKAGTYNPRLLIVETQDEIGRVDTPGIKVEVGDVSVVNVCSGNRVMVVWVPGDKAVTHVDTNVGGFRARDNDSGTDPSVPSGPLSKVDGAFVAITHAGIIAFFVGMVDDFYTRHDPVSHEERGAMALLGKLASASVSAPMSGERYIKNLATIDRFINASLQLGRNRGVTTTDPDHEPSDDPDDSDGSDDAAAKWQITPWNVQAGAPDDDTGDYTDDDTGDYTGDDTDDYSDDDTDDYSDDDPDGSDDE